MLKYSVLLLMDIQAAERHGAQIILRGIEERLMSGLGSLSCVQMANPACSYWTVQCHLLTDMTGAKADTTYTNSHSILCT